MADGSTQDYVLATSVTPAVDPSVTEVDVVLTDGSTKKFVAAPEAEIA